jgi:hypothetical protein
MLLPAAWLLASCLLPQIISSEHVQWESEHSFRERVVQRVQRAGAELGRVQRAGVGSAADASALSLLGGRAKLKYL